MNILIATSEAAPFAKTGGLADVCGALPRELCKLGHHASLILPAYRGVYQMGLDLEDCGITLDVPVGNQIVTGRILKSTFAVPNGVPLEVYFVEQREYFDRPTLYGEGGVDYRDNCERFVFFSRAVLESVRLLNLQTDLIHCNDWQTALIPVLFDAEYRCALHYENLATLLTIHNLAYQGRFWHWDMLITGLDWKYFHWRRLEFFGDLNLLKGGIIFADAINTVSPTYAQEIQTLAFGCGMDGVLRGRRKELVGILNGVSYDDWNPATDKLIAQTYDETSWQTGKVANKLQLQAELKLPQNARVPMIGIVGRLVEQKGFDLILDVMKNWAQAQEVQWVILGTGHPHLESRLRQLMTEYPNRISAQLEFSDRKAHQIEAAADLFLMPSRYEPCGLNQLYSLKYGTLPLVHATGGLNDTVTNCTEESLTSGEPTGFVFYEFSREAFHNTLHWAYSIYRNRPEEWAELVDRGMRQDWSWQKGAPQYVELYQQTIQRVKQTVCA